MFVYDNCTHLAFKQHIPGTFTLFNSRTISSLCWLTRTINECKEFVVCNPRCVYKVVNGYVVKKTTFPV